MKRSFRLVLLGIITACIPVNLLNATANVSGSPVHKPIKPDGQELMEKMSETITTLPVYGVFCRNSAVVVEFKTTGTFNNDNIFSIELSDATGSFASPTVIGAVPGPGSDIPSYVMGLVSGVPGTGYRIRIVSSSPAVIGTDNGTDLVITGDVAPGIPTVTINGPTDFCHGSASTFLISSAPTGNLWYPGGVNTNPFIGVVSTGCYYTLLTAPNGCTSSSVPVCVNVNTPIFTFLAYSKNDQIVTTADTTVTICEGDSAQLSVIIQGGVPPFDISYSFDGLGSSVLLSGVGDEPFGNDHIYRFYTSLPGTYYIQGLTDHFPTNCGSDGNFGVITINTTPPPVTAFSYNPFCGSPSQPPIPAQGFLGGGTFSFDPEPNDGATINPNTGVVSGAASGSSYTVKYIVQGQYCEASSNTSFTVNDSDIVDFTIAPFCANSTSGSPVTAPGFVGGGTYSFAVPPADGASISAATGRISGASPLTTYTVRYTSPAGLCQSTSTYAVTTLDVPVISGDITNTLCGDSTGSITAFVSGGEPAYTYSWSNPGGSNASLENIPAGSYTLTVTDTKGCKKSKAFEVINTNQPELILTPTNATCGNANGTITLTVSASPGPFGFNWNDAVTTKDRSGLTAGNYSVTVTDSTTGCSVSASTSIANEGAPQANFVITNSLCAQSIGSVDVTVTGGTGTISHHWSNGMTTEDITGIPAGTYTDTIRDENACQVIITAEIINENEFTASAQTTKPTCGNPNSGSIDITINGGQAPFVFEWSPNTLTVTEDALNLPTGTYTVKITAASHCSTTVTATIEPAIKPELSLNITDATCGNTDGAINMTVNGGSGDYIYIWSNGETTKDINNLTIGKYNVLVKDAADTTCKARASADVVYGNLPVLSFDVTPSDCGDSNGAITMNISHGSNDYTIAWTGPNGFNAATTNIDNLSVGQYIVSLHDNNTTCDLTDTVNVDFNNAPVVTANVINTRCGLNNGLIDVTITGGTNPTVTWMPGMETTEDLVNLAPGTYEIIVSDEKHCEVRDTFEIKPSLKPSTDLAITQPSCAHDTGSIILNLHDFTSPNVYVWRKNEVIFANTQNVNLLGPGTYRVTVTDANGCVVRDTAILNYQNMPTLSHTITNTPCGLSEGAVNLTIDGGTPAFVVSWTGPNNFTSDNQNISNLAEGCYNATVTDDAGCVVSTQACVLPENSPQISFDNIQASCNLPNGSVSIDITGGVGPYTVKWDHNDSDALTLTGLNAGTYSLQVEDFNGCKVSASTQITNTGVPALTATQLNSTCGNADGSIDLQVSGGQTPYSFLWIPGGETTEDISGLQSGAYSVTVTDFSGCEVTGSFNIKNSDAPQLTYTSVNATCGHSDGSIDLTVTPAGNYNYAWTGAGVVSGTEDQTGLAAGTYKVIVTTQNNLCSDSLEITLINSNLFTVAGNVTAATCGVNNGAISLDITGGEAPFTYTWSCNAANTSSISGLSPGICEVTIQDDAGCEVTQSFEIENQSSPIISPVITNAKCGACNGSIEINLTGGTAPFTFNWNDLSNNQNRTGLCGGEYTLKVTDANNCEVNGAYTIHTESGHQVTVSTVEHTECGTNIGSINIDVTGGTAPYTFEWLGPDNFSANTEDISNLFAGNYQLTVTDAGGCDTLINVKVKNANEPTLEFTVTDVLCGDSTGSIVLVVVPAPGSGGIPPAPGPDTNIYDWTGPDGFTASTKNITDVPAGTYEVTVTSGACIVHGSATINSTNAPKASITAERDTICEGETLYLTIKLSGTPPFTFRYTDGVAVNTIGAYNDTTFTFSVDPKITTNYSMVSVVEDADPTCFGSFPIPSVHIFVKPAPVKPVITTSGALSFCNGDSVILTSSYLSGNTWSNGETTQSVTVRTGGSYIVTVRNQYDCPASDTAVVNVMDIPLVHAGLNDTTVCYGVAVQLQATGADQYLWSPSIGLTGTIIANPLASPPETTTYVVTGTNVCGSATDSVTVNIMPVLSANLGDDRTVCVGDSIQLTVSNVPGVVYAWGPSSAVTGSTNKSSVTIVASNSTDIYLTTTNLNGCIDKDTVHINVNQLPEAPVLSVDGQLNICEGESVVINSSIGTFVRWYRDSSLIAENVIALGVTKTGNYTVEAYGGVCPVKSNTIAVSVSPKPDASIQLAGNNVICQGSCTELSAVTNGTISWISPDGIVNSDTIQACIAGTYVLVATLNGCTNRDSIVMVTKPSPEPPVISPSSPVVICENQTATLTSSYQDGNQWYQNGAHLSGFTSNYILLNSAGFYTVRHTDENGCSALSEPVEIVVKPVSPLFITASDSVICSGSGVEVSLVASTGFVSYQWSNDSTGTKIKVGQAGTYEVTGTNSAGCKATASYTVQEGPAITIELFSPVYYDDFNVTKKGAKDGSIDLTVKGGTEPFVYHWSNEANTEDLNGLGGGWYHITVTDQLGCMVLDSINLKEPGKILLPNGFTPNGDGFNDSYVIKGIQGYPGNKVTILNRWGNIVFSTTNYVNNWEGIANNGNLLPDGTYFIVVDLNDNTKPIEGFIDLRRSK